MTINLSDNDPRVSYDVAAGVTQSSFTVSFEFFDNDDLNVYVDGTLKTLTTDYTVSGGDGSTGTVTMSVTGASGGSKVVITRDIDLDRTTDFPSSGPFNIASLNTELDRFVAIAADLKDQADRALQLTDFDAAASLTLPAVDDRKGTVLAFNSTTGAVEAGPTTSNVNSLADVTDDIATLADIEDGTDATDAIQTVAGISSDVTTVSGISANVTTVAGISANVTTVAGDEADIGTVATNISNVNTVAGIDSDVTTVAGISANVTTVAGDSADIQAVAADATDIGTVASNIADVNTAATNISDIQNASTNAATATTKASEAATSATNAATSATNAATSATAAAASQTAAAASAASAASAYDSFDDRYLGTKSSDPTVDNDGNALVSGALYFSSTSNTMQVYDGASWIAATSAGNVSYLLYEYTATSGQTTFSGSDDNSATLSYTVNNIQVVMNGVILDPSDYTATSGTSVVLGSGASTGDLVNIYAFKSFTTADMVPASTGGTFSGDVTFAGAFTSQGIDDNATSTALTINTSGNVGIGTSSPSAKIDLGTSTGQKLLLYTSGDIRYGMSIETSEYRLFAEDQAVMTFGGMSRSDGTTFDEHMRIDSSGNVGIGTNSITSNTILHLKDTDTQIELESTNGSNSAFVDFDGTNLQFSTNRNMIDGAFSNTGKSNATITLAGASGGSSIQMYTASGNNTTASERMRIDNDGRLLVGTTSSNLGGSAVVAAGVQSSHTTGAQTMTVYNNSASCAANGIFLVGTARTANAAYDIMNGWSNGVNDKEFRVKGDGNVTCDGSFTGGGADYAEYFEWSDGNPDNEDRRGYSVVLDNEKIRKATSSDAASSIIGVISGNPSVIGDGDIQRWKYKYLRDDFGGYDLDENGDRVLNPNYDPDQEYTPREDRIEWDTVGLMGKLRIRKGQPTGSNWIKMRNISDAVEEWLVR
jgi:hypothetical protein